jgi:hypothetical protein
VSRRGHPLGARVRERAAHAEAAFSEHVTRSELRWRETVLSLEPQLASARVKLAAEKGVA